MKLKFLKSIRRKKKVELERLEPQISSPTRSEASSFLSQDEEYSAPNYLPKRSNSLELQQEHVIPLIRRISQQSMTSVLMTLPELKEKDNDITLEERIKRLRRAESVEKVKIAEEVAAETTKRLDLEGLMTQMDGWLDEVTGYNGIVDDYYSLNSTDAGHTLRRSSTAKEVGDSELRIKERLRRKVMGIEELKAVESVDANVEIDEDAEMERLVRLDQQKALELMMQDEIQMESIDIIECRTTIIPILEDFKNKPERDSGEIVSVTTESTLQDQIQTPQPVSKDLEPINKEKVKHYIALIEEKNKLIRSSPAYSERSLEYSIEGTPAVDLNPILEVGSQVDSQSASPLEVDTSKYLPFDDKSLERSPESPGSVYKGSNTDNEKEIDESVLELVYDQLDRLDRRVWDQNLIDKVFDALDELNLARLNYHSKELDMEEIIDKPKRKTLFRRVTHKMSKKFLK